jgi:hypothetical protein
MSTSAAYGVLHLHQGAHGASNRSGYGQVSGPSGSNRVSDPSGFSGNVVPVRWNAAVRRTPHDLSRQQHAAEIRDSRSIARRSGFNAQTTSMEQLPHAMTDTAIAPRSRVNEYASRASRANAGVPRRGARSRLKELRAWLHTTRSNTHALSSHVSPPTTRMVRKIGKVRVEHVNRTETASHDHRGGLSVIEHRRTLKFPWRD